MFQPHRVNNSRRRSFFGALSLGLAALALALLMLAMFQYAHAMAATSSVAAATRTPAASATEPATLAAASPTVPALATLGLPQVAPPTAAAGPLASLDAPTVQVVNGVAVELRAVQRDGDTLRADLCFHFPNTATNWVLGLRSPQVTLHSQGSTLGMGGDALTGWLTAPTGEAIGRCDQVTFAAPAALDLSRFTITVQRLMTPEAESPDCAAAQAKLDRAGAGIVIACHTAGQSFNFDIVTQPLTLTQQAAGELVLDSFSDIFPGPWAFSGSLPAPATPASQPGSQASATAADPRASGPVPDTLSFLRMDGHDSSVSAIVLPLACLARPGGCAATAGTAIPLPPTNALSALAWSPDGAAFAFMAGMDGHYDLYRVSAAGGGLTDLTPSLAWRSPPAWSPDGQAIAWTQQGAGQASEIWLMHPDGSAAHKLADGDGAAFSPDGAQIAYIIQSTDAAGNVRSDLYRLDLRAAGAQPVRLTAVDNLINAASFAPDARSLAFIMEDQGHWGVYVLNLDAAALPLASLDSPALRRISPAGWDAQSPVWSPGGGLIAYTASAPGSVGAELYVATSDGRLNRDVSNTPQWPEEAPAWSPDGARLAYVSQASGHFNIDLVNPDGTGFAQVTASGPLLDFYEPSWQP
jgi:TolB protein